MIPVALSRDIAEGEVVPVRHDGQEMVLWRDAVGKLQAWEDRCPHRGVQLSLGFIRENRLACLYHGWQYDHEGRCRVIPAHPALNPPSTIKTHAYTVVETAGMIWVTMAASDERVPRAPAEGAWHGVRSLAIRASEDETRRALVLDQHYWRISADRLIAFHMPEPNVAMVHLAVRDETSLRREADWLLRMRDTLEEIAC
ncbi:Rieske (2Fe-2S) protein [Asaia krungthepensis]|uniref:3-chlorobenzoate-3-4-dioxygenase oxygenase subunit n=1 Tax=Asaia krungthepensis NRIC 0535 TaxID=1307925 RepID=A0ABQ0Q530_9PROT|nr:Rieske (2Fe-2S) protein [Asaia krungthepensis]GBQ91805.1 3-chlorobenzoate-3-4-dioxygenase oxygenase subunit [Asaia krungthepensis NRIC 0535]